MARVVLFSWDALPAELVVALIIVRMDSLTRRNYASTSLPSSVVVVVVVSLLLSLLLSSSTSK